MGKILVRPHEKHNRVRAAIFGLKKTGVPGGKESGTPANSDKEEMEMKAKNRTAAIVASSLAASSLIASCASSPSGTETPQSWLSYEAPSKTTVYKFDFGGAGAADGFTAVGADDAYSKEKGFGFRNTAGVRNVESAGEAEKADAVEWIDDGKGMKSENTFAVDLDSGIYEITVTAGGPMFRESVAAEGFFHVMDLTGGVNGTETWQMPVTDGQLDILVTAGKKDTRYALSSLEIAKVETEKSAPAVWLCGDSTVCAYYKLPDDAETFQYGRNGWGQHLGKYIHPKWQVRNLATGGQFARGFYTSGQHESVMAYIKPGDYYIIAIGINDKTYSNESEYYETLCAMIDETRAKGAVPVLVYQQGRAQDVGKNLESRWFGPKMQEVAAEKGVKLVNLFKIAGDYYESIGADGTMALYAPKDVKDASKGTDTMHLSPALANTLAQFVAREIPELRE